MFLYRLEIGKIGKSGKLGNPEKLKMWEILETYKSGRSGKTENLEKLDNLENMENLIRGSLSRGRRHIGPQLPNMRKVVWRPVAPYHHNGDREPKDPYHVEGGMDKSTRKHT